MPKPLAKCDKPGTPPCPPQPASGTTFTLDEVKQHGMSAYQKGREDALDEKLKDYLRDQGINKP